MRSALCKNQNGIISIDASNKYSSPFREFITQFGKPKRLFGIAFLLVVLAETISYSTIGIAYSYFQAFLIVFQLLRGKLFRAILLHLLFVLTSLEWPADLALRPEIYTYRTVSIFGVSISTIVLGFLFLVVIFRRGFHFRLGKEQIWFLMLFFLATLTGFFGLMFSDYRLTYFISDLQYWTVLIMSTSLGFYFFSANKSAVRTFENVLLFVLCSRSLVSFFGSLFGFQKGVYGGISTFTYDAIDLLIPLVIFALFDEDYGVCDKLFIGFCWTAGILNLLLFAASGKGLLLFVGVVVGLMVKALSTKTSIITKSIAVVLIICVGVFLVMAIPVLLSNNLLFSIKFEQSVSLLSMSWIKNPYKLPGSPRDRVLEFYNTAAYYAQYPLFIITGRGFGGYFEDNAFYNYTASDRGGYSTEEVKTRKFVNPHESLNVVFLKYGLSGILVWFVFLSKFVKFRKNQFRTSLFLRISGFVLFLLFLGFSLKIALVMGFCIASIMVGDEADNAQDTLC